MNVYQVTNKWTTFNIPMGGDDMYYNKMEKWLKENCSGTYQIFFIADGFIGNGENGHKYGNNGEYSHLLQVNLVSAIDVMAFKLRWS